VIFWVDAQLPPQLAPWLRHRFDIESVAVRDVGLRDASDQEIFQAARDAKAIVISKDSDFRDLLERLGPPPQVVWITCGNTTNQKLMELFDTLFLKVIALLQRGEPLIEIA